MSTFEHDSERFDQYLSGAMSAEEQSAFEAQLKNDEALASALKLHKLLRDGIKESARQDIKQYLREHGKVEYWGGTMWPRSMKFAAAAALLVFASLYVVIRYYIQPESVQNMAIKQPSEFPVLKQIDSLTVNGNLLQERTLADHTVAPPPPPVTLSESNERAIDIEPVQADDAVAMDMEDVKQEGMNTYGTPEILADKLMSDTFYFAAVLDRVTEVAKDAETTEKHLYSNAVRKKSASRIPAPSSNSNQAEAAAKPEPDTIQTKTNTMGKKKTSAAQSRLHVEFWSSPVNFKGYRLIGYDLRLYGVNRDQIKLVYVGSLLYMVFEGRVFELPPCSAACNYKQEADADITGYILEHTK